MKNILFSATRQFNPGDEFILLGILNLLDRLGVDHNRLLYNRHPMITPVSRWKKLLFRKAWKSDNSFLLNASGVVDYVIIAGSPEWRIGRRMEDLFRFILAAGVPVSFLAVGAGSSGSFDVERGPDHELLRRVLSSTCELVTVRDTMAQTALAARNAIYLPCTGLFAARSQRLRTARRHIGLVFQNRTQQYNRVSAATYDYLTEQYRALVQAFSGCELLCHTNADFVAARAEFPDIPTRYSAFADDFEAIYDRYDMVVTPRVHGSGMASSLGIPSVLIRHSSRASTGEGFLARIVEPGVDLVALVEGIDIESTSGDLIAWKQAQTDRYCDLLRMSTSLMRDS